MIAPAAMTAGAAPSSTTYATMPAATNTQTNTKAGVSVMSKVFRIGCRVRGPIWFPPSLCAVALALWRGALAVAASAQRGRRFAVFVRVRCAAVRS